MNSKEKARRYRDRLEADAEVVGAGEVAAIPLRAITSR
jgi:hypothetical protein